MITVLPTPTEIARAYDPDIGRYQRISPIGSAVVDQITRLVGPHFNGSLSNGTSDNFWVTGRGTAATSEIANQLATLTGGTTNSDWCSVQSVRKARFMFANPNLFRALVQFSAVSAANTTTFIGAIATTNGAPQSGYCFAVSGTGVISVQSYTGAAAVLNKASGFSGNLGTTYSVPNTNMHVYEIIYFGEKVWFFVDSTLLHAETPTTTPLSQITNNNISISVVNATTPTSRVVTTWFASVLRFGKDLTRPQSVYIAGAATTVLKTGVGTLHDINLGSGINGTVTVYDNTAASGTILAVFTISNNNPPINLEMEVDFFTGLTVVTSASNQVTVVFD